MIKHLFSFFEHLTDPFPHRDDAIPPKKLIPFILFYTAGFKKFIIGLSLLDAVIAILEVLLFSFMGRLVDWLNTHQHDTFLAQEKWHLIAMAMVLLLLFPALNALGNLLNFQTLMGNFPMAIRWRIHRYLLDQSVSFYYDEFAGRIATKLMQTSLAIRETILKLLDVLVYVSVYFLSMLVTLFAISFWLMLPMLMWLFIYFFLQRYFVPKLKRISQEQAHARSSMTGRIVDAYTNITTIKLFAHSKRETDYAKDSMTGFLNTVYRQMRLVSGLTYGIDLLNYLLIFTVAVISITLWLNDAASTGDIAIAIAMTIRLHTMSRWVMFEVSALFENMGTVTDGMNTFTLPHNVTDKEDAKVLNIQQGDIRFEHLYFNYSQKLSSPNVGNQKSTTISVIKDLNLHIKAGERIGLVGRSGAGKSTLVNVLLRFYNLESGRVLIDGQDIAAITQDSLRAHIAMVTQDTALLHRSIRDNILYGRPDASEQELMAALEKAKASEFIHQLRDPDGNQGLNAKVGERGVKLSGGQRQRIAIARVILKNAPILILDEATSALDSEVEAAIQESLMNLMANKTVIAIAHRLSTIAKLDRLVVIDNGRIIESGTHQELLDKNGLYATLWVHQTGGFLGEG